MRWTAPRREVLLSSRSSFSRPSQSVCESQKINTLISCSRLNQAGAFVRVFVDGSVLLSHGGIEMGQGLHTKMLQARQKNIHIKKIILVTQVAAKELGVPMSRIYIADTNTDTVIIPNRLFLTNSSQILNRCQTPPQLEAAQGPILTGRRWSTLAGRSCNISGRSGSFRIILLNSNAFRTTREGNPNASWEEIIGKAYQTRTQLAAFGFYNTSPLEYEYAKIWVC